ncbi:hypothetical protein HTSR_0116 [Halodesulfurarchaeum formicicum]|uniref:Uncharacterized protein n=1 Tax=Halodesulfurarchaeum formicicum TaxID=1873524 RepID=A0A1D8S1T3_9EURY|nr:hypothetical protein [Halodesulfurarchaeum formicicum]AOW79324.1 hypothetical protein HTSR_0116 [Halodesulfurarchaeum formicicum]APE94589.1 hypothetical protein HSR6_0115 [Halodesulfurarchaeum formicicum]
MADLGTLFKQAARRVGRTVGAASSEFSGGRIEGTLPREEDGRARIVCRKHAERRAVQIDSGRPTCFEPEDPDCESCLADIEDGTVETW